MGCTTPDAKRWAYEESVRVPLLVRYPPLIRSDAQTIFLPEQDDLVCDRSTSDRGVVRADRFAFERRRSTAKLRRRVHR